VDVNITGVKPGTGTNKSSDNTSTKYNRSKTRKWTLQKFRQHIHHLVLLPLYLVDVLSELLLVPVPGLTLVIFGGCVV
jgi:hypothetical protein